MSSRTQPRVKEIRQKNSSGYNSGIPIGTDGLLVDMLSKLDLEEELKLGSNHSVEVQDKSDGSTLVKQFYYTDRTKTTCTYSTVVNIGKTVNNRTSITIKLYKGSTQTTANELHSDTIEIDQTTENKVKVNEEVV